MKLAIIGCGHISKQYGEHIGLYPEILEIAGATDLDPDRAKAFCETYGGRPYKDLDAILADPEVDTLVNLTISRAHFDINCKALRAGKHVYTEKSMALTYQEALETIDVGKRQNRRVASAPSTFLGECIQTASKVLENAETLLGSKVRVAFAEVNWGQIEKSQTNPAPYYQIGPVWEVAVYALTSLAYLFGPACRVTGFSTILKAPRVTNSGVEIPVTAPDFVVAMVEYRCGLVVRLTTDWYINKRMPLHHGIEFHADDACFHMGSYHNFNTKCSIYGPKTPPIPVPLLREAERSMDRAAGLVDLAEAIRDNRPHRCSGELAAHVIETMEAIEQSSKSGAPVEVSSEVPKIPPMEWAENAELDLAALKADPA